MVVDYCTEHAVSLEVSMLPIVVLCHRHNIVPALGMNPSHHTVESRDDATSFDESTQAIGEDFYVILLLCLPIWQLGYDA